MEDTRLSHYRIGRRLGRGGMGEVYQALDENLEREVALKFIAPELASDPDTLKRFEREARAAAALSHPHIATLYAFDRSTPRPFIVMELMSGESLRDRLARGRLEVDDALAIARDVASGLALAHRRGIAHRDIKPENLMFDRDGAIKITDFGLARATQASRLTLTGGTLGTAAYMAPESVRAAPAAAGDASGDALAPGAPVDVFALGVTLHEMLAGELPFAGDSPLALLYVIANEPPRPLLAARPDCPEAVAALVSRMLEKDPASRPDAATVARELARGTGVALAAPADEPPSRPVTSAVVAATRTEELPAERLKAAPPVLLGERALEDPRGRSAPRAMPPAGVWWLLAILGTASGLWWGPGRQWLAGRALAEARQLNNRGYEALQHNDTPAAHADFIAALERAPHYAEPAVNLARLLQRTDRDSAAMLLTRVLREHGREPSYVAEAHAALGDLDVLDGASASAASHYALAAAADPTNATWLNNQANALIDAGRPDTARVVLARAIALNPARAPLYKNMGLAWLRSGATDSAAVWLDRAETRDPTLASVWSARAELASRRHDLTAVRTSLTRFVALGGDTATARALGTRLELDAAQ